MVDAPPLCPSSSSWPDLVSHAGAAAKVWHRWTTKCAHSMVTCPAVSGMTKAKQTCTVCSASTHDANFLWEMSEARTAGNQGQLHVTRPCDLRCVFQYKICLHDLAWFRKNGTIDSQVHWTGHESRPSHLHWVWSQPHPRIDEFHEHFWTICLRQHLGVWQCELNPPMHYC